VSQSSFSYHLTVCVVILAESLRRHVLNHVVYYPFFDMVLSVFHFHDPFMPEN